MITKTYDRCRVCTYCKKKILAGEPHIRFQHTIKMRGSQTINICPVCIEIAYKEVKPKIKKIKDRYLLEDL